MGVAVEASHDLGAQQRDVGRFVRDNHTFGEMGEFRSAQLALRVEAVGETDDFGLITRRQGFDFLHYLFGGHERIEGLLAQGVKRPLADAGGAPPAASVLHQVL